MEDPGDIPLYNAPDDFGPGWLLPSSAGGKCKLDGMPIDCNERSEKMELGFVATEYLTTRSQHPGRPPGNPAAPTLKPQSTSSGLPPQGRIVGFGLGIFSADLVDFGTGKNSESGWYQSYFSIPQNRVAIGFDTLWDDLGSILANPICGSFIADLVGTAQELTGKKAHAFSVEGMLAELARNPKNGTDGINLNSPPGSGSAGWDEQTGKGYVDLGPGVLQGHIDADSIRWAHRNLALVLLHEIIHTATKGGNPFARYGGYSDVELAQAVFEISKDPKDNIQDIASGSTMSPTGRGGVIWDRALRKYCK